MEQRRKINKNDSSVVTIVQSETCFLFADESKWEASLKDVYKTRRSAALHRYVLEQERDIQRINFPFTGLAQRQ